VRDLVDPVVDESLARFVVDSHTQAAMNMSSSEGNGDHHYAMHHDPASRILQQEALRKYIHYAKRIRPELSQMDVDKIAKVYAQVRKESITSAALPITVRHLESIVRMAEAHARMHLRTHVRTDDIDLALRVLLDSFIQAQKHSVMGHLRKAFARYVQYKRDADELVLYVLNDLVKETLKFEAAKLRRDDERVGQVTVRTHDLRVRAKEVNVHDLQPFFGSAQFRAAGYRLVGEDIIKDL
jgi:DNA replication licensing factor MCM2